MSPIIPIITAIVGLSLNALAADNAKSPLDDVLDPNKYWEDLSEASKEEITYEARRDAKAVFPYVPFVFWSGNDWSEPAGVFATEFILEKRHNLALNTLNRLIYDHEFYYDLFELTVMVSREHGKVSLDDIVIPPEDTSSTLTITPMPNITPMAKEEFKQRWEQEAQEAQARVARKQEERKLREKQQAERNLLRQQQEDAEIRRAEKDATDSIKGATPYPQ
jgi:hypothetical protein